MPVEQFPQGTRPEPNASLSDAVNYVQTNPSGLAYLVSAVKWVIGLVGAFLKKPR